MTLVSARPAIDAILVLQDPESGLFPVNHIFEPEYHQDKYVKAYEDTASLPGAFQVGDESRLARPIVRGVQPEYADDDDDPSSLLWEGMIQKDGNSMTRDDAKENVCALKSASVRWGFVDLGLARSISRSTYQRTSKRAAVQRGDVLINSTGDGTIGRVAVFEHDFPAVVDGHVAIVRYKDLNLAWYVAAFLLSDTGQRQIYRYINGSSGQVEIYPQDLARIWVRPPRPGQVETVRLSFSRACASYDSFVRDLNRSLASLS